MADDGNQIPYLPDEWRQAAETVARVYALARAADADDGIWARILQGVERRMLLRGVEAPPLGWQAALARDVGRA